jgi:hypothetical protein
MHGRDPLTGKFRNIVTEFQMHESVIWIFPDFAKQSTGDSNNGRRAIESLSVAKLV